MPEEYSLVALVTRREWLILYPTMPAALHILLMVWDSVLCPRGWREHQQVNVGFPSGFYTLKRCTKHLSGFGMVFDYSPLQSARIFFFFKCLHYT